MATVTTSTTSQAWRPDVIEFAPDEAVPDALILSTATKAGDVEGDAPSVRVAFVVDDDAQFTDEGATIPESNPGLDEVTVFTGKITKLVRVSREQFLQDQTAGRLSSSVQRSVVRKANQAYLTQAAPTAPAVSPPAGLLNLPGLVEGGAVSTDLDVLVDLLAELEGHNATPSHILLDPTGWAALRKLKTAEESNASLLGAGTVDAARYLLDLPVIVSAAMPAGTGLVIDSTAVASVLGTVNVAQSEHAYFEADSIAVRCTWRIGWNLVHPDRLGTFTVTTAA